MRNTPYVKKYDGTKLLNPITKENPYLHEYPTVREEESQNKAVVNNKKGIRLVVTNLGKGVFMKTKIIRTVKSNINKVVLRSSKMKRKYEVQQTEILSFSK